MTELIKQNIMSVGNLQTDGSECAIAFTLNGYIKLLDRIDGDNRNVAQATVRNLSSLFARQPVAYENDYCYATAVMADGELQAITIHGANEGKAFTEQVELSDTEKTIIAEAKGRDDVKIRNSALRLYIENLLPLEQIPQKALSEAQKGAYIGYADNFTMKYSSLYRDAVERFETVERKEEESLSKGVFIRQDSALSIKVARKEGEVAVCDLIVTPDGRQRALAKVGHSELIEDISKQTVFEIYMTPDLKSMALKVIVTDEGGNKEAFTATLDDDECQVVRVVIQKAAAEEAKHKAKA